MIEPLFRIKKEKETQDFGHFVIEPLELGFGHTLGNALRRVLLSALPGAAITQVKIAGVKHKFSTLEGLKEDIIEFILGLKQVKVGYEGKKPVKLTLEKTGPGEIKAGDIKTPANVKIANPDLVIGNLASRKNRFKAEMIVETGYGYLPAEEREVEKLGEIPIDAIFGPILQVNYRIESTRVGRRTDLNRLVFEITTDGSLKPSQALKQAAEILVGYFQQIASPKKMPKKEKAKSEMPNLNLRLTVEELDLPTRIANALRKGGYGTVANLVEATEADLAKVKNLGEKSVNIVEAALSQKGVSLKKKKK
ncbi:MAG TPA: DNA-directed RNA polymerase subunit alpha [Patescibacteria group bacterium]|nr:DNA-directed RNA polymerase subunit alpha [Patescibacteria group bacterium]